MNARDTKERTRLRHLWARNEATPLEIERCVELNGRHEAEEMAKRAPIAVDPLDERVGADLFYHRRRLDDRRERRRHGIPICADPRCRRHFTPTKPGQTVCHGCLEDGRGSGAPKPAPSWNGTDTRADFHSPTRIDYDPESGGPRLVSRLAATSTKVEPRPILAGLVEALFFGPWRLWPWLNRVVVRLQLRRPSAT